MKIIYIKIIISCILFGEFIINNSFISLYKKENFLNDTKNKVNKHELNNIQNYIDDVFKGISIKKNKKFYSSHEPKISIIITVYNGVAFLKTALLSIQNQDLEDIEIIMIDDFSLDKSLNLMKELKSKDPRIVIQLNFNLDI